MEKGPEKINGWKVNYEGIRVWRDGRLTGKARLNLICKKRIRLNLIVCVYKKGRWPFFGKPTMSYVVNIPLSMDKDIDSELSARGYVIRKKKNHHKWKKKRYRLICSK